MAEKTFTIAGTSILGGVKTMRFATGNPKTRTSILLRNGHKDPEFFELPKEMTKAEAAAWLIDEKKIKDAVLPAGRTNKKPMNGAELAAFNARDFKAEKEAAKLAKQAERNKLREEKAALAKAEREKKAAERQAERDAKAKAKQAEMEKKAAEKAAADKKAAEKAATPPAAKK